MKAVVRDRYGLPDVLRLTDVDMPAPADNEVLVKVHAVSLNASDWEVLRGKPMYSRIGGPFKPRHRILGSDIAGRVEAVGRHVTRFQPGDDVFADALNQMGGFAEYACLPEDVLERIPEGMSHEVAACLPQAGAIALQGIHENEKVKPGARVLINGAGGGSGVFAIQLAKLRGAEVTGVDNGEKQEFMRSLGADHVIDYAKEDFTKRGHTYDLILDVVAHRSASAYKRALAPGGRYLYVGGSVPTLFRVLLIGAMTGRRADKKLRLLVVKLGARHLAPLLDLVQAGKVTTIVDRRFPLRDVPEALRYFGEGHVKGKVVIAI